jgi:hypothetical protein
MFLEKVEAAVVKMKRIPKIKGRGVRKPRSLKLKPVNKMSDKDIKAHEAAAGDKDKVSFANLPNTRKLIPLISNELGKTDPFYYDNSTWDKFLQNVAPQLFLALLLDMKIVPLSKRAEFTRHMKRVLLKVHK